MIVLIIAMAVSFIPSVLLYLFLSRLHGDDKEYKNACWKSFIAGVLCSFGVILLAFLLNMLWLFICPKNQPLLNDFIHTFILAAFAEELVKQLTAYRQIKKNRISVSWLDCIAFTGCVGIGFEIIEAFVYFFNTNVMQILVRGITLMHGAYALLMGYFIGKLIHTGNKFYMFIAFFLPFILHGAYDFSLADSFQAINDNFVFIPFILVFITVYVLIHYILFIRKVRNDDKYTNPLKSLNI